MAESLLDLRVHTAYVLGHHADATHLPFAELIVRRHELPLPGSMLSLVHDVADELQQAIALLAEWGYSIAQVWQFNQMLAQQWQQQGHWRVGTQSRRLWQPSASLQRALTLLPPVSTTDWALDVACGSGRDALALAEHGFQVLAVDCKADALERLQVSARAHAVEIQTHCTDLETGDVVLPQRRFALINVARYLHRPLLPQLGNWLQPGGMLVYETFMQGAEQFGGPRRPAFLLAPGELANQFASFDILHDQQQTLPDGRPMQQFIARKCG